MSDEEKDARIVELEATVASLRRELSEVREENFRLYRQANKRSRYSQDYLDYEDDERR